MSKSKDDAFRSYTKEEIKQHQTKNDLWLLIENKVYDVSGFVDEHPGGSILLEGAGKDATDLFLDVGHGGNARDMMKQFYIGELKR